MRLKWSDSPGIWGWAVSRETIIKQPLFCELWLYSSSKALFSIRVSLFLQWDAKQINQWIMCTVQSIFSWNGLDARFPADMYFNNSWEITDRLGLVLGWEVKEWSSWHVAPSTHPQSCIWGFKTHWRFFLSGKYWNVMRMPESYAIFCRLFELARDYFRHVVPDSKVRMKSVAMNGMEVFKCATIDGL